MNKRVPYYYSILQYVHDIATGEFVNVGVVVHSAEQGYLEARCRTTYKRVSEFFPDLDSKSFKSLMKIMNARLDVLSSTYCNSLDVEPRGQDLRTLIRSILPEDDSALRWSAVRSGISSDLPATLQRLYARNVTRYDNGAAAPKRSDADVLRHFSKELERRHISKYFHEKTIEGQDDKVVFQSAWKNGVWHCVEPLSFDLSAPDSIKAKARMFLGQMTSVADTKEKLKLYVVMGAPTDPSLQSAFEHAVQIVRKVSTSFDQEIYAESDVGELASKFQAQIAEHKTHQ